MKVIDILKNKNLIDERELWVGGQIHSFMNKNAAVALENKRYFSILDNELIVTKIRKNDAIIVDKYSKDNLESVNVKSGLIKKFTIVKKNGEKILFDIGMNKKALPKILEIIQ